MAVDEWLFDRAERPLLRIYRWLGDWVSYGYALTESEARQHFPDSGLRYVRRWTGGGVVDHRRDWTYTLVIPGDDPMAGWSAPERYLAIHAAVAATLEAEGIAASLSDGGATTGSDACFSNPVTSDITDSGGGKLAGAGQRLNRNGVLHQGSVLTPWGPPPPAGRATELARRLATEVLTVDRFPDPAAVAEAVKTRYGNPAWACRRQGRLSEPSGGADGFGRMG